MDIRLTPPDGWVDRSMIAVSAPEPTATGVAPNLVVTRDVFLDEDKGGDKERIRSFADRQLGFMREQLPEPVVHSQKLTQVAGKRAAEILVSWNSSGTRITQWVVFIARDEERVAVSTATANETDFAAHEPTFRETLAHIEL